MFKKTICSIMSMTMLMITLPAGAASIDPSLEKIFNINNLTQVDPSTVPVGTVSQTSIKAIEDAVKKSQQETYELRKKINSLELRTREEVKDKNPAFYEQQNKLNNISALTTNERYQAQNPRDADKDSVDRALTKGAYVYSSCSSGYTGEVVSLYDSSSQSATTVSNTCKEDFEYVKTRDYFFESRYEEDSWGPIVTSQDWYVWVSSRDQIDKVSKVTGKAVGRVYGTDKRYEYGEGHYGSGLWAPLLVGLAGLVAGAVLGAFTFGLGTLTAMGAVSWLMQGDDETKQATADLLNKQPNLLQLYPGVTWLQNKATQIR